MQDLSITDLYRWCSVPLDELENHPGLRVKLRIVEDSEALGRLMARELADALLEAGRANRPFRVILPCGPRCWYAPFSALVNAEGISMRHATVFHMDECLDWQGRLLPHGHPYNFRSCMEDWFYGGILPELNVPLDQRHFPEPANIAELERRIAEAPVDLTMGGWGQDGHLAYNQARRNPYSPVSLDDVRNSGARVQENNTDTILALANRSFGGAWQFVPPMSVTLGVKQCLCAKKVRVYSDTGSWKQTALRVALFSAPVAEYPMTLLQEHPDAVVTATRETARHPIAENPGWRFPGVHA